MASFIYITLLGLALSLAVPILCQEHERPTGHVWIPRSVNSSADAEYSTTMAESFVHKHPLHKHVIRETKTCRHPTDLKDSELFCTLYSSKIVCEHTCMFGHTLSSGIRRKMQCWYEEDKWTPVPEFETCQPFVDCGLVVGPGGSYSCNRNFMRKGPYCTVSCLHYEDKNAVPPARYECDINGKWSPQLPFCAKAGSGIKLVNPPNGPKTIL